MRVTFVVRRFVLAEVQRKAGVAMGIRYDLNNVRIISAGGKQVGMGKKPNWCRGRQDERLPVRFELVGRG